MKQYFIKVDDKQYGVTKEEFERTAKSYDAEIKDCEHSSDQQVWRASDAAGRFLTGFTKDVPTHRVPTIEEVAPIPAESNPFQYDAFSMGSDLTRGWMVMHPGFDNKESPYPMGWVILVNQRTGQRFKVSLHDDELPRYKMPKIFSTDDD